LVYRLIEKGTTFNLEFKNKLTNENVAHSGALYESVRDIVLLLTGDGLYDYCSGLPQNALASFVFHRGQTVFSFEGKYEGSLIKNGVKLTEFTAIGVIKESSRRVTQRFTISVDAALYPHRDAAGQNAVCSGRTSDISCDSISLLSNDNIDISDARYYAKFVLFGRESFSLPAKFMRKNYAPPSLPYRYIYVILFDFSSDQREKNRLLDAFIKNSLEAGRP